MESEATCEQKITRTEVDTFYRRLQLRKPQKGVSWKAGKERFIAVMHSITGQTENVGTTEALDELILSAFRDLSVLKDPGAAEVFMKLRRVSYPRIEDDRHIIWARNIKDRRDGSAVIILHVSNRKRFVEMITNEAGGDLDEGILDLR